MHSVKHYDHLGIGVRSIEAALPFYRDMLGGELLCSGDEPKQGFRWLQLAFPGGSVVELLEPLGEQGFLHDFLDRRGEGVHHITVMVEDIRDSVAYLRGRGYEVVGENYADPKWLEAFVHPRSAHGVVVQLAQRASSDGAAGGQRGLDLEAILR